MVTSFSQENQAVTEDNTLITTSQKSDPVCNKKNEASSEAEDLREERDEEDYTESKLDELYSQDFAERLAEMGDWDPPRLHGKKGKLYLT